MATNRWLGRAAATYDKYTITVANTWAANDTGTITINGKALVLTVGTTATTAQVATELVTAFNASGTFGSGYSSSNYNAQTSSFTSYPEFSEIKAAVSGSTVILTHKTAGVPFVATVSENTVGTGTLSIAHTVTATGPNYADNTANWSNAATPANGDDVIVDGTDVSILYGMDQSAVTATSLYVGPTFSGGIGLPEINESGGYTEYRDEYWKISGTTITIDARNATRIKLDVGSVQMACEVRNTGTGDADTPAVLLKGTHDSNTLEMHGGSVGMAFYGDETAHDLATLRVADGEFTGGAGLSTATAEISGGTLLLNKAPTTLLTQRGGESTIRGSGAVTTITATRGTVNYQSSGTITAANIGGTSEGATLDCSGDMSARTITTLTLNLNGRVFDPHATLTLTNNVVRGSNVQEIAAS